MSESEQNGDGAANASKPSPLANPRTRSILWATLILVLIIGIAWFARYQLVGKYIEGTNNAYLQSDAVTVSSRVAGYVEEVLVADNQLVKAGQPLLRIDARDYRAQSAQFQAQIAMAEAEAEGIRAQIAEQEASIRGARVDLDAARGDATFAAAQVDRYTPLAASGAESREKLALLRSQAGLASAKVKGTRADLLGAERRIGSLQAQLNATRARAAAARAQFAAAQVNLGSTLIRAATSGRIGNKTARVGQFVQPGSRLMSVVPEQVYVSANFKETQVGLMRSGQPVEIEVDALPGVVLHGRVDSLAPGTGAQFSLLPPQNATGNFTKIVQRVPVRIAIAAGPETQQLLVPGMSVSVSVDTRSGRDARERVRREQEALARAGQ